jgi:dTDP-4-dehydrorhamnose 3,5-epimerase
MIEQLDLPGLWCWTPRRHRDARGWFSETFNQRALRLVLGDVRFVQDNRAYSRDSGVLRGLHFQIPPMAQDKLVHVEHGSIRDVVVDLRRSSPVFGRCIKIDLSSDPGTQLFIPKGCAHGYVTREPDTVVAYKVSNYYSPEHAKGIHWRDPVLAIDWGIELDDVVISENDSRLPLFTEIPEYFE